MCIWAHFNDDQAFWRFINNDEAKKHKRTWTIIKCFLLPRLCRDMPLLVCVLVREINNPIVFVDPIPLCFMNEKMCSLNNSRAALGFYYIGIKH